MLYCCSWYTGSIVSLDPERSLLSAANGVSRFTFIGYGPYRSEAWQYSLCRWHSYNYIRPGYPRTSVWQGKKHLFHMLCICLLTISERAGRRAHQDRQPRGHQDTGDKINSVCWYYWVHCAGGVLWWVIQSSSSRILQSNWCRYWMGVQSGYILIRLRHVQNPVWPEVHARLYSSQCILRIFGTGGRALQADAGKGNPGALRLPFQDRKSVV